MSPHDEWVWIPNWDGPQGFQHYKTRDPLWIKNYTRLLSHDAYRDLSHHQRGILHSVWMAYAASARRLRGDTLTLTRQLGQRVTTRDLDALSHAGFIQLLASTALAERLQAASEPLAIRAHAQTRSQEEEVDIELGSSSSTLDTPDDPNGRPAHVWQDIDNLRLDPETLALSNVKPPDFKTGKART